MSGIQIYISSLKLNTIFDVYFLLGHWNYYCLAINNLGVDLMNNVPKMSTVEWWLSRVGIQEMLNQNKLKQKDLYLLDEFTSNEKWIIPQRQQKDTADDTLLKDVNQGQKLGANKLDIIDLVDESSSGDENGLHVWCSPRRHYRKRTNLEIKNHKREMDKNWYDCG